MTVNDKLVRYVEQELGRNRATRFRKEAQVKLGYGRYEQPLQFMEQVLDAVDGDQRTLITTLFHKTVTGGSMAPPFCDMLYAHPEVFLLPLPPLPARLDMNRSFFTGLADTWNLGEDVAMAAVGAFGSSIYGTGAGDFADVTEILSGHVEQGGEPTPGMAVNLARLVTVCDLQNIFCMAGDSTPWMLETLVADDGFVDSAVKRCPAVSRFVAERRNVWAIEDSVATANLVAARFRDESPATLDGIVATVVNDTSTAVAVFLHPNFPLEQYRRGEVDLALAASVLNAGKIKHRHGFSAH